MLDLPAGVLATQQPVTPTQTRPTAATDSRQETAATPAGSVSTDSDAQATEGDRVTIRNFAGLPQSEASAGIDSSSLQAMLESIGAASSGAPRSSASSGFAGFSMQSLLDSFGQNQITNRLENLGRDLEEWLDRLGAYDAEQAQRLALLLNLVAELQPEGFEDVLARIANTLEAFSGVFDAGNSLGEIAAAAASQAAEQQQASLVSASTQIVHFSLDIEVSMSSTTETVLAQMRDAGIEVQTTRVSQSQSMKIHIEFTGIRQQAQQSDPLVLDLNGDGVNLTGIDNGAVFDIDADGVADRTAFVQGDDALLAIDRNGNGIIDDGSELFGDQNGAVNGFEELAKYDDNGDGVIDYNDSIYESLRLLHDVDGDGMVQAHELSKLSDLGVASLDLGYLAGERVDDGQGNTFAERSAFTRTDGTRGGIVDVWLGYRT